MRAGALGFLGVWIFLLVCFGLAQPIFAGRNPSSLPWDVSERPSRPGNTDPNFPLIPCSLVPSFFRTCSSGACIKDKRGNIVTFKCSVVDENLECSGARTWYVEQTCELYGSLQFPVAFVLSLALGLCGADRFYLGHTVSAIFKLLTLGGLGVWCFVDIILLLCGTLGPADGSRWAQFY